MNCSETKCGELFVNSFKLNFNAKPQRDEKNKMAKPGIFDRGFE